MHGLTITARCDVAQQKYPLLNYLPLVTLQDWLRRDGLDILIEQERSEQAGKLKSILLQAQISPDLPKVVSLEEIAKVHFPLNDKHKGKRKLSENFLALVLEARTFESIDSNKDARLSFSWFLKNRKPRVEEIVRRLSRHNVLGHYLLESLSEKNEQPLGFVCLLREVVTLPRNVAEQIGRGLDRATYCHICGGDLNGQGLRIGVDDLAMPIVEIGSPTIEHILQSFSQLFGRIGVSDPVDDVIGNIIINCTAD